MIIRKGALGIVLPSVTIGIFAVLIAFSLVRLSATEEDMRIEATQNMLWVIARSQVASLKLQTAASTHVRGMDTPVEVERRLNNFLSHHNILNHGPQRRQMVEMGFADALDTIEAQQAELRQIVSELETGDETSLSRLHAILSPYDADLARAANKAMTAEWDSLGSKLDNSRQEVSHIILSLIVIALTGAGMTFYLVRATRSARSRAQLLESEKALSQLLVTSSGEAIIAVDRERRSTLLNDAAATLFAITAEKTLHRRLTAISGIFSEERVESVINRALDGHSVVLRDLPFSRKADVSAIYLELRCFPLRDGTGVIGAIMFFSDVTEQYYARRDLSERRDYLEEQVALRTKELHAALERERSATAIYRNFAAMISHQFRTPLAIVDSSLQRLMRRSNRLEPDEVLERGGQARSAIRNLVQLVDSTLDIARLEAGQIEQNSVAWDLDRLIADVVDRQANEMPDRTVRYVSGGPSLVLCDPVYTEHIVVNLLSNAAKYAPPGTAVDVEMVSVDGYAGCRIINEGHIDPDDREHLFERFFRGKNASDKKGVGIGLYMAHSLAQLQYGKLSFEILPDSRIAFTLVLPLAEAACPAGL
ncbi:MAG: ATP-binding protein [Sphingopyxis sp.]|uniref:sensor histidine kinase n=1 Tax=unclassified Sphingopyxis TaxID=2614943 RepID=UPI000CDF4A43|nr:MULTISPECIES: ATP-binding protein [unclassified Sphingopyxis]AVA15046.1 hypothetical protein C3E99_15370 [Sphingopyxis sp. MG]MDZ3832513.1 ATP-binding protein [Sphingopyxis sp.]